MTLDEDEIRRLRIEGYGILTDSDVEDLYDEDKARDLRAHKHVAPSRRIKAISVYGGPLLDERGKPFPASWEHCCQHCCHPFDSVPFGIPMKYDELRNRFYCTGRYCSDSCMKAVMLERGLSLGPVGWNVSVMMRKAYGKGWNHRTRAAPVRTRLKMFGGDLDIDAFRAYTDRYVCWREPNNVLIEMEQLAELEVVYQQKQRKSRKEKMAKAQTIQVKPHVPAPPRKAPRKRRAERVPILRAKPPPKKTHTLEAFMKIT